MRVLGALAAGTGAQALSAIGARAGVSPSQTHRYLQSLLAAGMAVQDPSGRYDLGPAAISVGVAALSRLDSFARSEAALRSFTAETGRTSLLSIWGEAGAVVVRWFPGTPPIYSSVTIGAILPLLHSASGHVFLAFLPEQVTAAVLRHERAHDHAVLPINVASIREDIRTRLLSDAAPTMLPGLRAMAAPVFDLQGNLALVATAIATDAFDLAEDEAVAQRLQAACRVATEAVGGVWPGSQMR
jgi:DNA-binding IclR family transcriptional regulator